MPKAFIKNINQTVKKTTEQLGLKPKIPLKYFKQKEKRFFATPCYSASWGNKKNEVIFFKMLISPEMKDSLSLKKEALLTEFLYKESRQDQRITFPKFIAKNIAQYPFWLLREYLPGKIIGYHFKIYKSGLKINTRKKIVDTVLALQNIDYRKISGFILEKRTYQDYFAALKKIENELKLWRKGKYQNEIDFKKIFSFFEEQKKYFKQENLALTHGDLTLANFFLNKEGLFLTDWEWARLDNSAYDICRLWIQTFKYPNWRRSLLDDFLKTLPQNKKQAFKESFRLIAVSEAISEFFGNLLRTQRKTNLKQSMKQTINLSLKGFNQLINQKT